MIINFTAYQLQKFEDIAKKIKQFPEQYLNFDSVSDFYKAAWLEEFPQGTTWIATGLDNGAEDFYALIEYKYYFIKIQKNHLVRVEYGMR